MERTAAVAVESFRLRFGARRILSHLETPQGNQAFSSGVDTVHDTWRREQPSHAMDAGRSRQG